MLKLQETDKMPINLKKNLHHKPEITKLKMIELSILLQQKSL